LGSGDEHPDDRESQPGSRGLLLGDEFAPKGKLTANTWQGELPWKNFKTGGHP
jgi:hypothetical protein